MGLGKTVDVLTLVLANRWHGEPEAAAIAAPRAPLRCPQGHPLVAGEACDGLLGELAGVIFFWVV